MENRLVIPIETVEVRSSQTKKGKYSIKGKAKLQPGKTYSYLFKTSPDGTPINSLKEVFSENGWDKIKKKILSKQVFVDENHKTVSQINIDRWLNDLARETGKDVSHYKEKIKEWMKISEMPLFKLEDAQLYNDAIELDIVMNPYFKDIDKDHAAYFDAMWNSLQDGYINSISLNFNPTETKTLVDNKGNYTSIIEDLDVYGISLLSSPAHDDMFDVLDVAVRTVRTEKTEQGDERMADETKEQMKQDIKKELHDENLKSEVERLRKENLDKADQLKKIEEASKEAEKQKLIEEKEKLQAELEARNKQLQDRSLASRGLVPPSPYSIENQRQKVVEALEPIKREKHFGKAVALQAEFNSLQTLPPETLAALRGKDDIILKPRK